MKNKITVSIAGQEYTMVAEEGEDYVKRCAALVDSQVRDVMNGARLGRSDAAVLAAMNIADEFFKEQEAVENLRRQIKEGLDETSQAENGAVRVPSVRSSSSRITKDNPARRSGPFRSAR